MADKYDISKPVLPTLADKDIEWLKQDIHNYFVSSTSLSSGSIINYENAIRLFLIESGLDFSIEDINKWLLKKNNKNRSNYAYAGAVKKLLLYLGKDELNKYVIKVKNKLRKKELPNLSKQQIQQYMNNIYPSYWRHVVKFQYWTGARAREAITPRIENFDFTTSKDIIFIKPTLAKGDRVDEYLILPRKVELWINKVINGRTHGWLFENIMHEPILYQLLLSKDKEELILFESKIKSKIKYFNQVLNKASEGGLPHISTHWFRHKFSDMIQNSGQDLHKTMMMLRHKNIETTLRYQSIRKSQKGNIAKDLFDSM